MSFAWKIGGLGISGFLGGRGFRGLRFRELRELEDLEVTLLYCRCKASYLQFTCTWPLFGRYR